MDQVQKQNLAALYNLDPKTRGELILVIIQEAQHQSFDGWSSRDRSAIQRFLADIMLARQGYIQAEIDHIDSTQYGYSDIDYTDRGNTNIHESDY